MIDFIKLNISRDLFNIKGMDFFEPINLATSEMRPYGTARHKGLTIIRKRNYLILQGSLHKFYNKGEHNYNDFNFEMLAQTIDKLCLEMGISDYHSQILNLEFGVNISVDFNPTDFLMKQVICYKGRRPTYSGPVKGKGYLLQFELTNYILKLYDKGSQYGLQERILRFEVKTKKMTFVRKAGIKMLSDLKDLQRLIILKEILINLFDDILIYDPIKDQTLTEVEKTLYLFGINYSYWRNSLPTDINCIMTNESPQYRAFMKQQYRHMEKFNKLIIKHNLNTSKLSIRSKIIAKSNNLLSLTEDTTGQNHPINEW